MAYFSCLQWISYSSEDGAKLKSVWSVERSGSGIYRHHRFPIPVAVRLSYTVVASSQPFSSRDTIDRTA